MKRYKILLLSVLLAVCASCTKSTTIKLAQMRYLSAPQAVIYPDYTEATIPCNIAPLNFYILPQHKAYNLKAYGQGSDTLRLKGRYRVVFPPKKWHTLLAENQGGAIQVEIALSGIADSIPSRLVFTWQVRDSIDPYFSCRMIEPSYQMSSFLQTIEYNLQEAETRVLFDNRLQTYGCANCHTYAQNDGDYVVYHVRFNRTGTFITTPDSAMRVDLKSPVFTQGGVYPAWHPNKNIIAFGTSKAYPFVHSRDIVRRTEVYDSLGDIILYDIARNLIYSEERLMSQQSEETFPFWSFDGKWLYFCQSPNPERDEFEDDVDFSKKIHYNLVRIAYDEKENRFGHIDTVIDGVGLGQTVSFPRLSPDGRFLVVCISDHGTFPIRHPESDLYILALDGREGNGFERKEGFLYPVKAMENGVNSPLTESYHTFSSNGRWLMFSSKREDNLYSRPYFTYVDSMGVAHRPFLMPQRDPAMYLSLLKSFNVPEFSVKPVALSAARAKALSTMPVKTPDSIVIINK